MKRAARAPQAAAFCRVRRRPARSRSGDANEGMTMTETKGSQGVRGRRGVSRRAFLKSSAGTAALLGAVNSQFPFGVPIALADGPEITKAMLGFIALTDAAPLFVAK